MGLVTLNGPSTLLDLIDPIFEVASISRWLWRLTLVNHPGVVAGRLLFELAIHELPSVPVLLAARGQRLGSIDLHDVTSNFLSAKKQE